MDSQVAEELSLVKLPPYSGLINNRIIVPSTTTQYFAVEQHFFYDCMRAIIKNLYVDEVWYKSKYDDVGYAIENRLVSHAKEHYVRSGYYEHRLPYEIRVDVPWYLDTYSDVTELIKSSHFSSAEQHFELAGYREGRLPYAGFELRQSK